MGDGAISLEWMPLYWSIDECDANASCTSIMVKWLMTGSNVTCGCLIAIVCHCWCVMCMFLDCNNNIPWFLRHSPPINIFVFLSKVWFFSQLGCAHTSHCQKCEFCSSLASNLKNIWKGVTPKFAQVGDRLMRKLDVLTIYAHKCCRVLTSNTMDFTFLSNIWLFCSTTPFWCGVYPLVSFLLIPWLLQKVMNSPDKYLPPLSFRKVLAFLSN